MTTASPTSLAPYQGYNPSYIHSRNASKYGGGHEFFIKESNRAIGEMAQKIREARLQGANLQELFWDIIAALSVERSKIAYAQNTANKEEFGQRRDHFNPHYIYTVVLGGDYQDYGDRLMNLFATQLKIMQKDDGSFQSNPLKITDQCDGRTSVLTISVLTSDESGHLCYALNLPKSIFGNPIKYEPAANEIPSMLKLYEQFEKSDPEQYHARRTAWGIYQFKKLCPSPDDYPDEDPDKLQASEKNRRSMWVLAHIDTTVGEKTIRMTDYITWMFETPNWTVSRTPEEAPITRMKKYSKIMLLHQEQISIECTLKEIAALFEKIVTWNRETQTMKELKDLSAHFAYLATHNMRDQRGTAAENEMLTHAMMYSLGVKYKADETRMVDLEAFANPFFSDFRQNYEEMVTLSLFDEEL